MLTAIIQATPPFGSKTLTTSDGVTHSLFARFTGIQAVVSNGVNTVTYTATYPWVKMLGIEVVNATALDTADLQVYDTAAGTYSGVPNALLNQFAYNINVAPNYYNRMAQFDADLYAGMVVTITYTSVAVLPRTVGFNLLMNEVKG